MPINTEFSKGHTKFEKMFFNGTVDPKGFVQVISESTVKEILETGTSELLDDLDEIGGHYAKSFHTRHTGHKEKDFISLYNESSANLQKFYLDVMRAWKKDLKKSNSQTYPHIVPADKIEDTVLSKGMLAHQKKIQAAAKDLINTVCSNKQMKQRIGEELRKIKETKNISEYEKTLDDITSKLSDHIGFLNANKDRVADNFKDSIELVVDSVMLSTLWTVPADIGVAVSGGLVLFLAMGPEVFIPVIIGGAFSILIFIGGIALVCANSDGTTKRWAVISVKRYISKVQSKLKELIKRTNDAERFVTDYLKTQDKRKNVNLDIQVTDGVKKVVRNFVEKQKKLWEPYTTAEGRGYFGRAKKGEGKHKSGIRTVSDDNNATKIRVDKVAYATIWKRMVVSWK